MTDETPALLVREEALAYWDKRHRRQGALRSGGHIGIDEDANELFYAVRLGQLIELIGHGTSPDRPFTILDAGCGKGYFSGALARAGHDVLGIDGSGTAISHCRSHHRGRFVQAPLIDFANPFQFDVVGCIDVLFHILDEGEWEASLRVLAAHVRLGGRLIITDIWTESTEQRGSYIVHRPHDRYEVVLSSAGLRFQRFLPFNFRENRVGWFLFTKA